jgi:hypothetical protein
LPVSPLTIAGILGGVILFAIGGSRRVSHAASFRLTWAAPLFAISCFGFDWLVPSGWLAVVANLVAWSIVAGAGIGYMVTRVRRRASDGHGQETRSDR